MQSRPIKSICLAVKSQISGFSNKNSKVFKFIIVLAVLIYGYEVFDFSLSVDEEREIVNAMGTSLDITKLGWLEGRYSGWI